MPDNSFFTTHDRAKLRMLVAALANSGSVEFAGDDKELCIRTLGQLSLSDLPFLQQEGLVNWVGYDNPTDDTHDEDMAKYSRLLGVGLVRDRSIPGLDGANKRHFQLSSFGQKFLAFIKKRFPK